MALFPQSSPLPLNNNGGVSFGVYRINLKPGSSGQTLKIGECRHRKVGMGSYELCKQDRTELVGLEDDSLREVRPDKRIIDECARIIQ